MAQRKPKPKPEPQLSVSVDNVLMSKFRDRLVDLVSDTWEQIHNRETAWCFVDTLLFVARANQQFYNEGNTNG
jgi:hypothetical protein